MTDFQLLGAAVAALLVTCIGLSLLYFDLKKKFKTLETVTKAFGKTAHETHVETQKLHKFHNLLAEQVGTIANSLVNIGGSITNSLLILESLQKTKDNESKRKGTRKTSEQAGTVPPAETGTSNIDETSSVL